MSDTPEAADPIVPFIQNLLVKLVDHPEEVEVRVQAGHPTLYEARVAPDDIGQVVGREGRIVKALRTLVAAAAQKRGERATFEIAEPRA
ncbi:MAG: KH domain-containing protein [Acidobacteriota bacterium]|nr:KH domain-containing protein [Acidobacteriota bacterium]